MLLQESLWIRLEAMASSDFSEFMYRLSAEITIMWKDSRLPDYFMK